MWALPMFGRQPPQTLRLRSKCVATKNEYKANGSIGLPVDRRGVCRLNVNTHTHSYVICAIIAMGLIARANRMSQLHVSQNGDGDDLLLFKHSDTVFHHFFVAALPFEIMHFKCQPKSEKSKQDTSMTNGSSKRNHSRDPTSFFANFD